MLFEEKNVCEHSEFTVSQSEEDLYGKHLSGILLVPQPFKGSAEIVHQPDATDFAKWLKTQKPNVEVAMGQSGKSLVLHNTDLWLPFVYLASDVALPIYLNLVSSYIFDKMKGSLKGETARIHLKVDYKNPKNGNMKRLVFEGTEAAFAQLISNLDIDEFGKK